VRISETIGLALFTLLLLGCGFALPSSGGTNAFVETTRWISITAAFGLAILGALSVLAGVPVARFGMKRALWVWGMLAVGLAFGLFTDWLAYWSEHETAGDVLFEWTGVVMIWAVFLLLPQLLARGGAVRSEGPLG
jgi:hypothetical protein